MAAMRAARRSSLVIGQPPRRPDVLNDAEWSGWSNVAIAKACAVSHMTVGRPKAELTSTSGSDRTYRNNHGSVSTMNTAANRQTSRPSSSSRLMVAASQTKEDGIYPFARLSLASARHQMKAR
jgi:hypothetical protein